MPLIVGKIDVLLTPSCFVTAADLNHLPNDRSHLPVTNKLSAPPTPMSAVSAMSPAPSLQEDLEGLEGLSPSIPQSPMSPVSV